MIPKGIPSIESLWLPPHYSKEIKKFQDSNENPTRNLLKLEEILIHVFPQKYQQKYYEIAE